MKDKFEALLGGKGKIFFSLKSKEEPLEEIGDDRTRWPIVWTKNSIHFKRPDGLIEAYFKGKRRSAMKTKLLNVIIFIFLAALVGIWVAACMFPMW